jgi:hypothetical protein
MTPDDNRAPEIPVSYPSSFATKQKRHSRHSFAQLLANYYLPPSAMPLELRELLSRMIKAEGPNPLRRYPSPISPSADLLSPDA